MKTKKLKIGQIVKTDDYDYHKELFKIVKFTPKRVKVIRLSSPDRYSWFIKANRITEIVEQ